MSYSSKILLIEDERLILKTLIFKLTKEGFNVISAPDGRKGLEMFEKERPDLVVTDIMMPYVNGLEVVKQIKETPNCATKVILLTSLGQEETVLRAFELGADDFMTKPFSPAELTIRIKKHLKDKFEFSKS